MDTCVSIPGQDSPTYYFYERGYIYNAYAAVMLPAMTRGWRSSDAFSSYFNSSSG